MRILVTGASGFIGRSLVRRLVAEQQDVRMAAHSRQPVVPWGGELAPVGPVGPDTDWRRALAGIDVVVHLAGRAHILREQAADPLTAFREVNAEGTATLAEQAAQSGVRRVILASSIGVHGRTTDGRTPFHPDDTPAPGDPYAQSKWEAEQALRVVARRTGVEPVVVRPALVYGPGAGGNVERMMRWTVRGIPLPFGRVHNRRALVGIDNLVDLLIGLVNHSDPPEAPLLVSDGEDLSTPDLIRRLARALGRPARLVPVPPAWIRMAGRALGRARDVERVMGSLEVDSRPTRQMLDWTPPVSVDEGLARMARAWMNR